MGMTAILHTWGQTLIRHVHLHCLVPGGAISKQGHWHGATSTYLFPVRALSRHFRGHFVSGLRKLIDQGACPHLEGKKHTDRLLDTLMSQEWVVYSKACLQHTETVVAYLARYSHRVALTDARLHPGEDSEQVLLDYKDYRDENKRCCTSVQKNSSAATCCMCCPRDSCGFANMDSWPTDAAPSACPGSARPSKAAKPVPMARTIDRQGKETDTQPIKPEQGTDRENRKTVIHLPPRATPVINAGKAACG